MDSNIYLIYDKVSSRVATPMFLPNHASAVRECATMLARLDPMALNDFELFYVGSFSSEVENVESVFSSICLLDSNQVENLSSQVHEYFARFEKFIKELNMRKRMVDSRRRIRYGVSRGGIRL